MFKIVFFFFALTSINNFFPLIYLIISVFFNDRCKRIRNVIDYNNTIKRLFILDKRRL